MPIAAAWPAKNHSGSRVQKLARLAASHLSYIFPRFFALSRRFIRSRWQTPAPFPEVEIAVQGGGTGRNSCF
jgi:hypothetical protein